jgi:nicotinamide-nucleotide amidase
MRIELVTIGDELLLGFTIDTNAAHLARELAAVGVSIERRATVGDEPDAIAAAVREALDRTGAVITTGGLGPTADDMTKPSIAALFGRGMRLDEPTLARHKAGWAKRFPTRPFPEPNVAQSMVPEGAELLVNNHGSAPGIWLEDERARWVAMLPGVPREMRGMLQDTLLPRIVALGASDGRAASVVRSRTLRTTGIAESALAERLGELQKQVDGMNVASLPGVDGTDLRITARDMDSTTADRALDTAAARLRERAGAFVYGEGDVDLAALVLDACRVRGLRIGVGESCTGGMLGARLTAIPGSSDVVLGGVIAYSNGLKASLLGVPAEVLAEHGAVSDAVVRAMASGARSATGASVGVGITGIAGPGGGTDEKPVGTVWIASDVDGVVESRKLRLIGDRAEVRQRAAQAALEMVRRRVSFGTALTDPTPLAAKR